MHPAERAWIRFESCWVDFLSALCGHWPDNGAQMYRDYIRDREGLGGESFN